MQSGKFIYVTVKVKNSDVDFFFLMENIVNVSAKVWEYENELFEFSQIFTIANVWYNSIESRYTLIKKTRKLSAFSE